MKSLWNTAVRWGPFIVSMFLSAPNSNTHIEIIVTRMEGNAFIFIVLWDTSTELRDLMDATKKHDLSATQVTRVMIRWMWHVIMNPAETSCRLIPFYVSKDWGERSIPLMQSYPNILRCPLPKYPTIAINIFISLLSFRGLYHQSVRAVKMTCKQASMALPTYSGLFLFPFLKFLFDCCA